MAYQTENISSVFEGNVFLFTNIFTGINCDRTGGNLFIFETALLLCCRNRYSLPVVRCFKQHVPTPAQPTRSTDPPGHRSYCPRNKPVNLHAATLPCSAVCGKRLNNPKQCKTHLPRIAFFCSTERAISCPYEWLMALFKGCFWNNNRPQRSERLLGSFVTK